MTHRYRGCKDSLRRLWRHLKGCEKSLDRLDCDRQMLNLREELNELVSRDRRLLGQLNRWRDDRLN